MQGISVAGLQAALASETVVFDLRPAPPADDRIPGALSLRLEDVQAGRLPELPKDQPVILVCERGQLSELAGLYLEAAGFQEVYNLLGGMRAWRQAQ
ncbi:MAG TPA: rhodanese-like domain-containing protein [Trueperaceae bacterium]